MSEKTPTQEIIKKATKDIEVKDDLGRIIKLRKPGILAQYRLIETLGKTASNETYVGMVMPLLYVAAIDDDSTILMGTKKEVEALIQRLGEEGVGAVMKGVEEHFSPSTPAEDKETIKK